MMLTETKPIRLAARAKRGELDGLQEGWPRSWTHAERYAEATVYDEVAAQSKCCSCGGPVYARVFHAGDTPKVLQVCAVCGHSQDV